METDRSKAPRRDAGSRAIKGGFLANLLGRAAFSTLRRVVFRGRRPRRDGAAERTSELERPTARAQGVVPPPSPTTEAD